MANLSLNYKHISSAVDEALTYIDKRRKGEVSSLKTSKKKLNAALLNGVEWGRIFTIAGLSGSGKSLICEELKRDFCELNPDEDFDILSFEFEMLAKDQVTRNLSGRTGKSTKYLYSGQENVLTDEEFQGVQQVAKDLVGYPIYYVDNVGTVDQIEATILNFVMEQELAQNNRGLVVTIDHILLTRGKLGVPEKEIVDALTHRVVALRKRLDAAGVKVIFILLSQLNRGIESSDRIINPNLHYPTKNDIFAASSVYYCSDYVLISHKPAIVDGIHKFYGPPRPNEGFPEGLPVFNPNKPDQPMVYWHLIKERFGQPKILLMCDDFAKSKVSEWEKKK